MNVCHQCGQPQIVNGVAHPMIHLPLRGGAINSEPSDMASFHLDCMPHEIELMHREQHGKLIDKIKNDTAGDYAARRQWAEQHAAARAKKAGA